MPKRGKSIKTYIGFLLITLIIASLASTAHKIINSNNAFGPDPKEILPLILLNFSLAILLLTGILWRLIALFWERHRGKIGSRIQTRILILFSLLSIIPTITVATFSTYFFNFGIQSWFNERVDSALDNSLSVAKGYLDEHKKNIQADVAALVNELNRSAKELKNDVYSFGQTVKVLASIRQLSEANILRYNFNLNQNKKGATIVNKENKIFISNKMFREAFDGEIVVITSDNDDKLQALVYLKEYENLYLLVGRSVDSKVLNYMKSTEDSVNEYRSLKLQISSLQIQFLLVFILLAVLLLLSAIWVGLMFAGNFVKPIISLVNVTEKVKAGSLDIRIDERPENDEIGTLERSFNRMIDRIGIQHNELKSVNEQIEERRRFIEAVLSGVSVGIITVDEQDQVVLANDIAQKMLSLEGKILKKKITDLFPQITDLLDHENKKEVIKEIQIDHDGYIKKYFVKIMPLFSEDVFEGYVITFDDVTTLENAQKQAAWADVARRIAHEIKNPLTPIHLAIERIQKKYVTEDESKENDTLKKYLKTITRQINNIGEIVEEFVSFARMPAPKLKKIDLFSIIKDATHASEIANPNIDYVIESKIESFETFSDEAQMTQLFNNILKNAAESIHTKKALNQNEYIGKINVKFDNKADKVLITITDNGTGFPKAIINKIAEPYVTTKEKGMGLGLAIVKKIIEEHEGKFAISNIINKKGEIEGARIAIEFVIR